MAQQKPPIDERQLQQELGNKTPFKDGSDLSNKYKSLVLPLILKSIMGLAPGFVDSNLVRNVENAARGQIEDMEPDEDELMEPDEETSFTGDMNTDIAIEKGDIAADATASHYAEQGMSSDAAMQAANDNLTIPETAVPISPLASQSSDEFGEDSASSGPDGMGGKDRGAVERMEQAAAGEPEDMAQDDEPETLPESDQPDAGRRMKNQQRGPASPDTAQQPSQQQDQDQEPEQDEQIIPTPADVVGSTTLDSSGSPKEDMSDNAEQGKPENSEQEDAGQEGEDQEEVPENQQKDKGRELLEEQEGDRQGQDGLVQKAGDKALDEGKQDAAATAGGAAATAVAGPEAAPVGEALGKAVSKAAADKKSGAEGAIKKKAAKEAVSKTVDGLQALINDVNPYSVFYVWILIAAEFVIFYASWTKQEIPIVKVKIELNAKQKIFILLHFLVAFLVVGAMVALFVAILNPPIYELARYLLENVYESAIKAIWDSLGSIFQSSITP